MKEAEKSNELLDILEELRGGGGPTSIPKTLIFMARKLQCDEVVYTLANEGYRVDSIHGDKSQQSRTKTMDRFRWGRLELSRLSSAHYSFCLICVIQQEWAVDYPRGDRRCCSRY